MATWEKGPTTEPRTRDLRPNAEFQPREPWSRSRSFVPHGHLEFNELSCYCEDNCSILTVRSDTLVAQRYVLTIEVLVIWH